MAAFALALSLLLSNHAVWSVAVEAQSSATLIRTTKGDDMQVESVDSDGTVSPIKRHDVHGEGAEMIAMTVSASGEANEETLSRDEDTEELSTRVQDIVEEVEEMIRTGSKALPEKIKIIKKIVQEELIPDLKATRQGAVKQIGINIAAVKQCNDNSVTTQQKISETTEVSCRRDGTLHVACREEEKIKNSTKSDRCKELDDFLNGVKVPAEMPAPRKRDQMVKYVQTMSEYFCPTGPTVTRLDDACKAATKEHGEHKASCDRSQYTFEAGFCTWRTEILDTCSASSQCYKSTVAVHNEYVKKTKTLVARWKNEYTALNKIVCYTDVWLSDGNAKTVSADQLSKCKSTTIDTSPMDIEYPPIPAQAKCDTAKIDTYPGTTAFPKVEYAKFIAYTKEVIPCLKIINPTVGPLRPPSPVLRR